MTSSDAVRFGVIGLGRMGQNHVRVLSMLKGADLRFAYDLDPAVTARVSEAAGIAAVGDLDEALAGVDAVVIASPTTTHAAYVYQAAEQVRNLFVEKPLAGTLKESAELRDFAASRGLNLQVGFIERFNPAVQQIKKLLDDSTQVVSVDFARTNKISARITDVDVVADLMIHDIDLALHLNGAVTGVSACGVAEGGMIDFASALLTHANGRFSRIVASRITDKKMRSIQATCRDMFVDCDLLRKEITLSRQSEVVQPEGEPYRIIAQEETVEVKSQEALLSELQAFLQSCRGATEEGIPGVIEGYRAMEVCHQVQRAILD